MIIVIENELSDGDIERLYYFGPKIPEIWNLFWKENPIYTPEWDKDNIKDAFIKYIESKGFSPTLASIFPFFYENL